ncbi:hypothetical protein [Vibrio parahaemolyticus]|uniref:hypothetical protein n=1 Tax=Vibrio parahaemolyticus TaxID=670 RepID=UPI001D1694FB|nr:hypothetical protein [Vibrio parahaemolyticus]MCC3836285.1 hypothetical protein [Vibrio parahaemolyticus]
MNKINLEFDGKSFIGFTKDELVLAGVPELIASDAEKKHITDEAKANRKSAYIEESDPLYMEWQYDQTPEKEQAWRDKVAEIKARYPLPSES